jgi:hypothetical protein
MRLLFLLAALAAAPASFAGQLKPFATDGCSMWVDGTPANPNLWRHCCVAHDKDYWLGGSEAERKASDERLRSCVASTGEKGMGSYLYVNVRWGGAPFWMTPYRWGYGWDFLEGNSPRGYRQPSTQEQQQIDQLLPSAEELVRQDALSHPALLKAQPKGLSLR